ncbi:MAG TPA: hypothetical protein VM282_05555 [Acidimicrobiales bacterium]|nr:hypothetical protein [Acidimicrobiales bacterium]
MKTSMKTGGRRIHLAAALVLLIVACGGGDDVDSSADTPAPTQATSIDTTAPTQATSSASGSRIGQAGLVNNWNQSSQLDPSRLFTTNFKTSDDQIDVAFKLSDGAAAEVSAEWKVDGQWVVLPGALKIRGEGGKWSSFTFTPPSRNFNSGDYQVTLGIVGTAERKTLTFKIAPESTSGRFDQAGLVKKWDQSVRPDPSTFTTSFLPGDTRVYAVFTLVAGSPAEVTATWKYNGRELVLGDRPVLIVPGGGFGNHSLTQERLPAGDYEVVLAIRGTSQTRSLKFTVNSDAPDDATKFEAAGLTNRFDPAVEPNPNAFMTTFSPSDKQIFPLFKLTGGTRALTWVTAVFKYEGAVMYQAQDSLVLEGNGWRNTVLTLGTTPPGDYEAVLTILKTGETRSLKFSVR